MLEFIHNDFKIDLTYLKPVFTEESSWLKNELESDYSFPFDIPFLEWEKISSITHYNAIDRTTSFSGKLNIDGKILDAVLKVQEITGKKISAIVNTGFEGFPSFDKKLSELPLDHFPVENLKQHALTVITKSYPEVSHNFGMVYTDRYDPTSTEYYGFLKAINNFENNAFIENQLQPETNLDEIKNIMQPFPYLLHVLKKGFEADGAILAGDVLEIPEFQTALIAANVDYFDAVSKDSIPLQITFRESIEVVDEAALTPRESINVVRYEKSITVERKGNYILFGDMFSVNYWNGHFGINFLTPLAFNIKIVRNGVEIPVVQFSLPYDPNREVVYYQYKQQTFSVDKELSLEAGDVIFLEKIEAERKIDLDVFPYVADLKLIPVRYLEDNGDPIISINDKTEIDLKLCVPDMTFKALLEQVMALKKLYLVPDGNVVYLNFIDKKLEKRNEAVDFSLFDVEEPVMTINDNRSYCLKFSDADKNKDFSYESCFVSIDGAVMNDYVLKKETTQINIDTLPYPESSNNGIKSCYAIDDEKSKLRLVSFTPVINYGTEINAPVTFQDPRLLIPYIYNNNYKKYLNFLVNGITYKWENVVSVEVMRNITVNTLVYAYSNYHVFTEIEKERINEQWWKFTAKSECMS